VRNSLKALDGIKEIEVDLDEQIAIVIYETTKVEVSKMTQATTNIGFPSKVKTSQLDSSE
jgi:mercuric ion binding protein